MTDLAREAAWREQSAGEVVFLEGEASPGLYYLQFGWLKAVKSSPEGREQVLRFIGPGETFNEIGAFASRPNPATAIALESAGVWLLRREALMRLLRHQPDLAQRVIENMAGRVVDLVNLVADLSLRPITGRLARLLLDETSGDVLHRPRWHTQAELAARLGTVPDVVQRALRGLESEGESRRKSTISTSVTGRRRRNWRRRRRCERPHTEDDVAEHSCSLIIHCAW